MPEAPPKRIALIGAGQVAGYGHLPAIVATPGLELAAIVDPDPARRAHAAARFKPAAAVASIDELDPSGLDALAITSPAPLHHEHVLWAATHGLHCLCEKPLAESLDDAEDMVATMDKAGRMLITGFTYRFSPVAQQMLRLIREGAIGELLSMRLIYVWDCHGLYEDRADPTSGYQARRDGRMEEGGPMVDCGVHQIDLARFWSGKEVTSVTGIGAWVDGRHEAPDHLHAHLDHEGGVHTAVEISYSYGHTAKERVSRFLYDLIGTEGVLRFDRELGTFELHDSKGVRQLECASEKAFEEMYTQFHAALVRGEPGEMPTGRDGVIATQIAREATAQAIQRRGRSL